MLHEVFTHAFAINVRSERETLLSVKCLLRASTTISPISIASDKTVYPSIRTQNIPPLASLSLISASRPDCHSTRKLLGAAKSQRKLSALYFHFFAATPQLHGIDQYSLSRPLSQSGRIFHCSHNFECNPFLPNSSIIRNRSINSLKPPQLYVQPVLPESSQHEHAAAHYSSRH